MVLPGFLGNRTPKLKTEKKGIASTTMASASTASLPTAESTESLIPPDHIADESDLRPVDPEPPDLRDLNACLAALAVVFPDVQIEVFREMFGSFSGESRLALVADALLKNRATWVKGRWRVAAKDGQAAETATAEIPKKELFRSPGYKQAVTNLACQEFKGLSRSAIHAVLAESNYCYLDARQELVNLSSRSWRFAISSLFRRTPVAATGAGQHPLVVWKSTRSGSLVPTLKTTGRAELDRELFDALIVPLTQRRRADREAEDHQAAVELNNTEAEEAGSLIECTCCFTESTFEEFTACNAHGHMVCYRCVQHSISEAVFGQGWQRTIDPKTGTLRCPAVANEECEGRITQDHMHRAMLEEKNGAEVLHKLEQRLADHDLAASNLPLIRCPFCAYAEVDDIYLPHGETDLRLRLDNIISLVILLFILGCSPFLLALLACSSLFAIVASSKHSFGDELLAGLRAALARRRRRQRDLRFRCQNPACRRTSCLSCGKAWVDVHLCHESALVALQAQVEQAMSMAVKRVCPRCNTSFVKDKGCNKMTCPCGYKMCYVCRKDVSGNGREDDDGPDVGYRHFCQHFREAGDGRPCKLCNKCNLWEDEDNEKVLRAAREEAERKWQAAEKRQLSGAERTFLETGNGVLQQGEKHQRGNRGRAVGRGLQKARAMSLADLCDLVLDIVLV